MNRSLPLVILALSLTAPTSAAPTLKARSVALVTLKETHRDSFPGPWFDHAITPRTLLELREGRLYVRPEFARADAKERVILFPEGLALEQTRMVVMEIREYRGIGREGATRREFLVGKDETKFSFSRKDEWKRQAEFRFVPDDHHADIGLASFKVRILPEDCCPPLLLARQGSSLQLRYDRTEGLLGEGESWVLGEYVQKVHVLEAARTMTINTDENQDLLDEGPTDPSKIRVEKIPEKDMGIIQFSSKIEIQYSGLVDLYLDDPDIHIDCNLENDEHLH